MNIRVNNRLVFAVIIGLGIFAVAFVVKYHQDQALLAQSAHAQDEDAAAAAAQKSLWQTAPDKPVAAVNPFSNAGNSKPAQ